MWCKMCGDSLGRYSAFGSYAGYCDDCSKVIKEFAQRLAGGSELTAEDVRIRLDKLVREVTESNVVPSDVPSAGE